MAQLPSSLEWKKRSEELPEGLRECEGEESGEERGEDEVEDGEEETGDEEVDENEGDGEVELLRMISPSLSSLTLCMLMIFWMMSSLRSRFSLVVLSSCWLLPPRFLAFSWLLRRPPRANSWDVRSEVCSPSRSRSWLLLDCEPARANL